MKTAKELELSLLIKESKIQLLKIENNKLREEIGSIYEDKIDKVIEYIRLNYCNNENIRDCWHEGFQPIIDILWNDILEDKDEIQT